MTRLIITSVCLCFSSLASCAQDFLPLLESKEVFCIEWSISDKISNVPSRDYHYTRSGSTNYIDPSVHLGFTSLPYQVPCTSLRIAAGFDACASYDNTYSLMMVGVTAHNVVGGISYGIHSVPDPNGDFKNRTGSYRRDNAWGCFIQIKSKHLYIHGLCEYSPLYTYHVAGAYYRFTEFHQMTIGFLSEAMKGYGLDVRYYLGNQNATYLSLNTMHVTPAYRNETQVRDGFQFSIHSIVF